MTRLFLTALLGLVLLGMTGPDDADAGGRF